MDCRKFHRNLEDYLEDGLDFPGRFGMERHAQQCISCGKDLSNAQSLRRMVRDLERVKAPANFETMVLNEIGKRKANSRLSGLRKLWVYGFEFPTSRRLALASSCVAVLAVGIFYAYPYLSRRADPVAVSAPPQAVQEPLKEIEQPVDLERAVAASVSKPKRSLPREVPELSELRAARPPVLKSEQIAEQETVETDYVEFQGIGPDNRPVSIRWPNKPPIRYGHDPQQYFIRNISH